MLNFKPHRWILVIIWFGHCFSYSLVELKGGVIKVVDQVIKRGDNHIIVTDSKRRFSREVISFLNNEQQDSYLKKALVTENSARKISLVERSLTRKPEMIVKKWLVGLYLENKKYSKAKKLYQKLGIKTPTFKEYLFIKKHKALLQSNSKTSKIDPYNGLVQYVLRKNSHLSGGGKSKQIDQKALLILGGSLVGVGYLVPIIADLASTPSGVVSPRRLIPLAGPFLSPNLEALDVIAGLVQISGYGFLAASIGAQWLDRPWGWKKPLIVGSSLIGLGVVLHILTTLTAAEQQTQQNNYDQFGNGQNTLANMHYLALRRAQTDQALLESTAYWSYGIGVVFLSIFLGKFIAKKNYKNNVSLYPIIDKNHLGLWTTIRY